MAAPQFLSGHTATTDSVSLSATWMVRSEQQRFICAILLTFVRVHSESCSVGLYQRVHLGWLHCDGVILLCVCVCTVYFMCCISFVPISSVSLMCKTPFAVRRIRFSVKNNENVNAKIWPALSVPALDQLHVRVCVCVYLCLGKSTRNELELNLCMCRPYGRNAEHPQNGIWDALNKVFRWTQQLWYSFASSSSLQLLTLSHPTDWLNFFNAEN